jgi:AhpD family alkylhydroperoxidase
MSENGVLNQKEKDLIALSASVAAGCRPCTEHFVNASHQAGACDRGVTLAIETALEVRTSAIETMVAWAKRCQPVQPELDAEFRDSKRLVAALAAVAAAAAVNSVPDLEARSAAARKAGASAEQVRAAIGITHSVQRVAIEKVVAAPLTANASCCAPPETGAKVPGCGCR